MNTKTYGLLKQFEDGLKKLLSELGEFAPYWFGYERYYLDDSCVFLSSNAKVYWHHFTHNNLLVPEPPYNNLQGNMEFFERRICSAAPARVRDEIEYFAHGHTIVLIRYTGSYYEVFHFTYKCIGEDKLSYFSKNDQIYKDFAGKFLDAYTPIIHKKEYRIDLPKGMYNPYISERYEHGKVWVKGLQDWVCLTEKELQASVLTVKKELQEEVADIMKVSRRTVESHLRNVRAKLGEGKGEFVDIFSKYFYQEEN